MNALTIILATTNRGGPMAMVLFLLFAGVIGFFVAYYYFRSYYAKKISTMEAEKGGLERKVNGLQAANDDLNKKIKELEEKK